MDLVKILQDSVSKLPQGSHVRKGELVVPIEIRQFGPKFSPDDSHGAGYLEMAMASENLPYGINILLGTGAGGKFRIFKLNSKNGSSVLLVTNYDESDASRFRYFNLTFSSIEHVDTENNSDNAISVSV